MSTLAVDFLFVEELEATTCRRPFPTLEPYSNLMVWSVVLPEGVEISGEVDEAYTGGSGKTPSDG